MGKKAKTSRKGKKAWRKNISTEDIDEFIEKSTKEALTGGSLTDVPSDSLFFVDKSKDLSVRRKIEKHREKVLRCDSVLKQNPFVNVVPSSSLRKGKKKKKNKKSVDGTGNVVNKDDVTDDVGMVDIWEKGNADEDDTKSRKAPKPSVIPAVEVEPPGCSYNPPFEAHQDSLAQAVAVEMQKIYKNELGPQPVPLMIPGDGKTIDEEDMYFLEADEGSDDDTYEQNLSENEDIAPEKRPVKVKRVTRVELNKRARRKEQKRIEEEAKKKKGLSKEIDSLSDIMEEIAKEDEEKQKRHVRRLVVKQEKLETLPPRLGKHKFQPAPSQVLLSEEITGSLRKLKGCCTLLTDRFKSLEKRGLIPPSARSGRK